MGRPFHTQDILTLLCVATLAWSVWTSGHRVNAQAQMPRSNQQLISELRQHVKHVFVIYQENHSFDEYFGTYPGADNLATAQARLHGFRQYDPIGKRWVTPFLITDPDIESPGHSRAALLAKIDGGKNDQYIARRKGTARRTTTRRTHRQWAC